jgi:hypothetical protein
MPLYSVETIDDDLIQISAKHLHVGKNEVARLTVVRFKGEGSEEISVDVTLDNLKSLYNTLEVIINEKGLNYDHG